MRDAAAFIAGQSASAEAGLVHEVARFVRHAVKSWKSRRQVATLADFDEHMLSDIGLTRRDVREALELPFSMDPGRELQYRSTSRNRRGWNR